MAKSTSSKAKSAKKQLLPVVGIIMGSDSDLKIMRDAADILEEFGIPVEVTVVSARRTPQRMMDYASKAHERGIKVIIAGAGCDQGADSVWEILPG